MRMLTRTVVSVSVGLGLLGCGEPEDGGPNDATLLAFGSSTSTITLAWALPTTQGYTLERRDPGGAFAPLVALDAATTGYLDTGLLPSSYTYRIRATGEEGPWLEQTAAPSDEVALRTADEARLGEPVTGVIGVAGGSLSLDELIVTFPPGAVPDATPVELQRFVSPVGDDPGLEVAVGAPLSAPVQLTFPFEALDEPGNLAIAQKQADTTWVARPFVLDPLARTATLELDDALAPMQRRPASGGSSNRVMLLRARGIMPRRAVIPPGATLRLVPYAHFTDYPCDRDTFAGSVGCTMIALAVDPNELVRPIRETRVPYASSAEGYERDWLVNGAFGGSPTVGTVVAQPIGADYTAPAAVPAPTVFDVSFTSVEVRGGVRTPQPALHALITVANPRWRGSLSCVVSAVGTELVPGGSRVTTIDSTVSAAAEDSLVPFAFSMTITSATASYTRRVVTNTAEGTPLCPVQHRSEYLATHQLSRPDPADLVALVVDEQGGGYMLTSGFGANLTGQATLTNTYTATGDPMRCPPPPPNEVIPSTFQPFWSCGAQGLFTPGSNRIAQDVRVADQFDPPGETHYQYDFTRQ